MNIANLNEKFKNCSCGKSHTCPIDAVIIGKGALKSLLELTADYKHIMVVSDDNTYSVCGKAVVDRIASKVSVNCILSPNPDIVVPNEEKVEELEALLTEEIDLIVGVGSGVINDLCNHCRQFCHEGCPHGYDKVRLRRYSRQVLLPQRLEAQQPCKRRVLLPRNMEPYLQYALRHQGHWRKASK